MLFHLTLKPKASYTSDDQKAVLQLWAQWTPPEGFEIKSFHIGADARGFALIEATDAKAIFETTALWADVYVNYDIVPVLPADEAVAIMQSAITKRDAL